MRLAETYKNPQKHIYRWLLTGVVLIILMVVIGGITRLTQSGLSMVKWEPIIGAIPPLSEDAWNEVFEQYKQSPEYHAYNSHFTLSDFKTIFFWEYLHRLIGRIIGLVFLIPCIVFWVKGNFTKKLKSQVVIIFLLGALQGVLGWVMVKSGLVDKPHVSHLRLSAHLITAFILIVYVYWVALGIKYEVQSKGIPSLKKMVWAFIALIFVQITYGAFVAGLKAGLMYNTFPLMGNEWIPEQFERIYAEQGINSLINNGGIVQFIHRILAISILVFTVIIWLKGKKIGLSAIQKKASNLILITIAIQFLSGLFTLLYAVPVSLGVLHQFGAILTLLAVFFFLFTISKSKNAS